MGYLYFLYFACLNLKINLLVTFSNQSLYYSISDLVIIIHDKEKNIFCIISGFFTKELIISCNILLMCI